MYATLPSFKRPRRRVDVGEKLCRGKSIQSIFREPCIPCELRHTDWRPGGNNNEMEFVEVRTTADGIQISRTGSHPVVADSEILDRSPVLRNMMSPAQGEEHTTIALPQHYLSTWLEYVRGRDADDHEGWSTISIDQLIQILKVGLPTGRDQL